MKLTVALITLCLIALHIQADNAVETCLDLGNAAKQCDQLKN